MPQCYFDSRILGRSSIKHLKEFIYGYRRLNIDKISQHHVQQYYPIIPRWDSAATVHVRYTCRPVFDQLSLYAFEGMIKKILSYSIHKSSVACWSEASVYCLLRLEWDRPFFHLIYLVLYFVSLYILIIFLNLVYFEWVLGVLGFSLIFFLFSKWSFWIGPMWTHRPSLWSAFRLFEYYWFWSLRQILVKLRLSGINRSDSFVVSPVTSVHAR